MSSGITIFRIGSVAGIVQTGAISSRCTLIFHNSRAPECAGGQVRCSHLNPGKEAASPENSKKKREFREIGDLTVHEIEHAEKTLIKIVQAKLFSSEDSFPNMNVITDEEGLITFLSEKSADLAPLSSAMFLGENRGLNVPDIDYRGLLIQKKIKKGLLLELRLGEIVLIGDDIKKRMHWPLAKVIRRFPERTARSDWGTKNSNWNNVMTHSTSLSFGSAVDRNPDDPLNL
ncbi:integrase catalytic domain-containing protein [Trichonephila clavipes]|nr:integrase catalytic domain-containing protein [Trichonephila clavipes]